MKALVGRDCKTLGHPHPVFGREQVPIPLCQCFPVGMKALMMIEVLSVSMFPPLDEGTGVGREAGTVRL